MPKPAPKYLATVTYDCGRGRDCLAIHRDSTEGTYAEVTAWLGFKGTDVHQVMTAEVNRIIATVTA